VVLGEGEGSQCVGGYRTRKTTKAQTTKEGGGGGSWPPRGSHEAPARPALREADLEGVGFREKKYHFPRKDAQVKRQNGEKKNKTEGKDGQSRGKGR